MNRLTTLEANHTLYARYVEEQTASVREVLRKLNEEVGRLESIVSVPTLAINWHVDRTVALRLESDTGTNVPTYSSRVGKTEIAVGT